VKYLLLKDYRGCGSPKKNDYLGCVDYRAASSFSEDVTFQAL